MTKKHTPTRQFVMRLMLRAALCIGIFSIHNGAFAQASMSGGGYTLNGGISVFNAESSGGGYTMTGTGDPAIANSSGGGHTLMPTPFGGGTTMSSGSGIGAVPGLSGGGSTGGGFTVLFPASPGSRMNPGGTTTGQGERALDPNRPMAGIQWIDRGKGVDTDFDGKPDTFANAAGNKGNQGQVADRAADGDMNGDSDQDRGHSFIKTYDNDLGPFRSALMVVFILCVFFARIIRGSNGAYRISRRPAAIFIDYLVAFHKTPGSLSIAHPQLRDAIAEARHDKVVTRPSISTMILFDIVVVPALAALFIVWLVPISSILSLAVVLSLVSRLVIGKKISRG